MERIGTISDILSRISDHAKQKGLTELRCKVVYAAAMAIAEVPGAKEDARLTGLAAEHSVSKSNTNDGHAG
jgi:hypothetical protein